MTSTNVRSGSQLRKRARAVKKSKSSKYTCPRTGKKTKRISNSVWESSGGYIYAGGAYTLTTPSGEVFERMIKEHKARKKRESG